MYENKRWLNPKELRDEYGISLSCQAKMRMAYSSRRIPFSKIGKFIRYDRFELDKWLENHKIVYVNDINLISKG